jgi:hypothetical protein
LKFFKFKFDIYYHSSCSPTEKEKAHEGFGEEEFGSRGIRSRQEQRLTHHVGVHSIFEKILSRD